MLAAAAACNAYEVPVGCIMRKCGMVPVAAWMTEGASLVGGPESVFQG